MHRDRNAGWRHRSGCAAWRRGPRGQPHFCLATERLCGPPGRGDFLVSNFHPGNLSGNVHRSRHALNADTIREMHAAFRRGGRKAIETVMRNQPAVFLKLLVLLVPREMKMEHSGGVNAMTDEQIERAVELLNEMRAQRAAC